MKTKTITTLVSVAVLASIAAVVYLGFGPIPMPENFAGTSILIDGVWVTCESLDWFGWTLDNFLGNFK